MKPVPGTKYKQFQRCKKTTKQTPRSNSDSTAGILTAQLVTALHRSSHNTLHYSKAAYKQRRESPSFSHLLLPYQDVSGGEENAWHDSIAPEQLVIDA